MAVTLEAFADSAAARAALSLFLERSFSREGRCDAAQWQLRLAHWWDDNPFAEEGSPKGWVLRTDGGIAGFLGVIPTQYEDAAGMPAPALIATSWAIDEAHRHSALAMALRFQRLGRDHVLVDTTPSPQVQTLLERAGWTAQREIRRWFLSRWRTRRAVRPLPAGLRIIQDAREAVAMAPKQERAGRLGKRVTPDSLRWYLASPMREHRFLGVIDDAGRLSSYLIVTRQSLRGLPVWAVVDWFSVRGDPGELQALIVALARHPAGWPGRWWPLISVAAFPPDDCWQGLPALLARKGQVCHFHWLPPHLRAQSRRIVLAEGDWGL